MRCLARQLLRLSQGGTRITLAFTISFGTLVEEKCKIGVRIDEIGVELDHPAQRRFRFVDALLAILAALVLSTGERAEQHGASVVGLRRLGRDRQRCIHQRKTARHNPISWVTAAGREVVSTLAEDQRLAHRERNGIGIRLPGAITWFERRFDHAALELPRRLRKGRLAPTARAFRAEQHRIAGRGGEGNGVFGSRTFEVGRLLGYAPR